jgi:hypothetical protein
MKRRQMLAGLAAAPFFTIESEAEMVLTVYLELKTWRLHNSNEQQASRVADYLQNGLGAALARTQGKLAGVFSNFIGPDGPYYLTLTQYPSLAAMEDALAKVSADGTHRQALEKLGNGPGLPFVRVESSLVRSFGMAPESGGAEAGEKRPSRIFELRTYESQTFTTLARKISMFTGGEMQIFQRLGMRPVFFGETIVGPKQPNLTYMLSYHDLAARDRLWHQFGSDPEWKKLKGEPPRLSPI